MLLGALAMARAGHLRHELPRYLFQRRRRDAGVSYGMYSCLTSYTGAVPAEYYSLQKRPAYKAYQAAVNMFVPGPSGLA